jgi:hypothetical protein
MTIDHQSRRENRQFHPRHVIVMMLGTAAILYAAAVYSMAPAAVPLPERHAAKPATEARAPEAYVPVRSLGYVVFDWPEADGGVPGFGPMPTTGDSKGAQ